MCRSWSVTYRCASKCGTIIEAKQGLVSCGKSCPMPEIIPAAHIDKAHEKKYCAACGEKAMGRPPSASGPAPGASAAPSGWFFFQPPTPAAPNAPAAPTGWFPVKPPPAPNAPAAPTGWPTAQPPQAQGTLPPHGSVVMAAPAPAPPTPPPGPRPGFGPGQSAPPPGYYSAEPGDVPGLGPGHWLWK